MYSDTIAYTWDGTITDMYQPWYLLMLHSAGSLQRRAKCSEVVGFVGWWEP